MIKDGLDGARELGVRGQLRVRAVGGAVRKERSPYANRHRVVKSDVAGIGVNITEDQLHALHLGIATPSVGLGVDGCSAGAGVKDDAVSHSIRLRER